METSPEEYRDERFDHWPYAAESARANRDPEQIEAQAKKILARGVQTQRLVAFVGSGVSLAYGRLSWAGLVSALYDLVISSGAERDPLKLATKSPKEQLTSLWSTKDAFLKEKDLVLKSQVLSDLLAQVDKYQKGSTLPVKTKELLQDYLGFIKTNLDMLVPEPVGIEVLQKLKDAVDKETKGPRHPNGEYGLKPVLGDFIGVQTCADASSEELKEKLIKHLHAPSIGLDSPLRQLIIEWGIRRFITPNYDEEIERSLEALDFHRRNAPDLEDPFEKPPVQKSGHPSQQFFEKEFDVINFSRAKTGSTVRFAIDGARHNASVLHIHGNVQDEDSIVLTESDYQRLYLEEHPRRDLVNNAMLSNFSANPMLFVGSEANEDDLLRPMRQFLSGVGHRQDRMVVVILLNGKEKDERTFQKVTLLQKYGVYAIHVGSAGKVNGPQDPDWFATYSSNKWDVTSAGAKLLTAFRELEAQKREGNANIVAEQATLISTWNAFVGCLNSAEKKLNELKGKSEVLGAVNAKVITQDGTGIQELIDKIITTFKRFIDISVAWLFFKKPQIDLPFELGKLTVVYETATSRLMTLFLSAKLYELRTDLQTEIAKDLKLLTPYFRPLEKNRAKVVNRGLREKGYHLEKRHAVATVSKGLSDKRTSIKQQGEKCDEGISALVKNIKWAQQECVKEKNNIKKEKLNGRRTIIVCAPRGTGKGGQFDELINDSSGRYQSLEKLLETLNGSIRLSDGTGPTAKTFVLHLNLSFSNEIGTILGQIVNALDCLNKPLKSDSKDQLERLAQGLKRLTSPNRRGVHRRLLLVFGNAGVMFDRQGRPKNGQIRRVMAELMDERYAETPLDLVLYVGESQIPRALRSPSEATRKSMAVTDALRADFIQLESPENNEDERLLRRANRVNILMGIHKKSMTWVFPLNRTKVIDLAEAYFPKLKCLIPETKGAKKAEKKEFDELCKRIYFATGGSRFAQTLILAYLDFLNPQKASNAMNAKGNTLVSKLNGLSPTSAIQSCIALVLDAWSAEHVIAPASRKIKIQRRKEKVASLGWITYILEHPTQTIWAISVELMWLLTAFSHPIEISVLAACPGVSKSVGDWFSELGIVSGESISTEPSDKFKLAVRALLEVLVIRRLVFRLEPRPMPECTVLQQQEAGEYRYAMHRHMQRYFMRKMGGRGAESSQWDQFTTTLYASQPDEAPNLKPNVRDALDEVLQRLTRFPEAKGKYRRAEDWKAYMKLMIQEANCIRAAYAMLRSTYSVSAMAHAAHQPLADDAPGNAFGHMEHYRRLVQWVIQAASYWEVEVRGTPKSELTWKSSDGSPLGIFYPGELVWLYNECGVIALAQGKLQDAETMLGLALQAARRIESDDSGSLATRIKLHAGLVELEKGRPEAARQLLNPIAKRQGGHHVPPLIARYYLGLLEHIGGNYRVALSHYEAADNGLKNEDRSRAAAFVAIGRADVEFKLHQDSKKALSIAEEAINLAQHGGHQDVRVLALLGKVRICVDAGLTDKSDLFEILNFAQGYATMMGMPRIACGVHELRARLLMRQGEYHTSAAEATTSLEIAALYDMKLMKIRALVTLARIYARRGERGGALKLIRMGKDFAYSSDYQTCLSGFDQLEIELSQPDSRGGSLVV
jgi:tetratricopeptide (TPR) repeat protein